ncbi:hypothetical protein [Sphingomonas sp.]|uniref:hypothetical protein n=2 Tax=unclassified Sphingomonas TaxID=196159 RepID=UPI0035A82D41
MIEIMIGSPTMACLPALIRHAIGAGLTLMLLMGPMAAWAWQEAPKQQPQSTSDSVRDIVVAARPRARSTMRPPMRDVVDYYQYYCVESMRLTGRGTAPVKDPDWQQIDSQDLAKLGAVGPGARAFGSRDEEKGWTIFLRLKQVPNDTGLDEQECVIVIVGQTDQKAIIARMSKVLWSRPTTLHVGRYDGVDEAPGWDRWLWTGTPMRRSKNWASSMTNRGGNGRLRDTYVVITTHSYYHQYDYIYGELKVSTPDKTPMTVLSFNYVTRGGKK